MTNEQKATKDLLKFLKPFDDDTIGTVMWLRDFARDLFPQANELIYDNYNAVAFGWSPTDKVGHTICSIAVGRSSRNIHFGFYWGIELSDPEKILLGEGNQYRSSCYRQKEISESLYQKTGKGGIYKLTFKSKRPKANHKRTDNCKISFKKEATQQTEKSN